LKRRAVIFSPEAEADLARIGDWIAERAGSAIALAYVDRIGAYCLGFEWAAERGRRRDDIRPGLRVVGFEGRIAIAFDILPEIVTIQRVLYGGRTIAEI